MEVLVIDGGTGPDIDEVMRLHPWAQLASEPDDGIYDAMNKGLRKAKGQFVWFLNGGDEALVSEFEPLGEVLTQSRGAMVLGDYELVVGRQKQVRLARSADYLWHGLPTSHQAIFYPSHAAKAVEYDLRFRIAGDYQLTAQLHYDGIRSVRANIKVARFYADGTSIQHAKNVALEAKVVQREILHTSRRSRIASSFRHFLARTRRHIQTRL